MSGFVDINTDEISKNQENDKKKLQEDLQRLKDTYKNIEKILKQTREGNAKNKNDMIIKLNQNLMQLYNSIYDVKNKMKLIEDRYGESDRQYKEVKEWMDTRLRDQYNDLNEKLIKKGSLKPVDQQAMTKIFKELHKRGPTSNLIYGGKRKYKRNTRMKRKKLMCPKNCCGVSVRKCRCPKSCKHCNCHEIRRLRKKVRTCKKKRRRRKRTKKKRKRRRKKTRRRN